MGNITYENVHITLTPTTRPSQPKQVRLIPVPLISFSFLLNLIPVYFLPLFLFCGYPHSYSI